MLFTINSISHPTARQKHVGSDTNRASAAILAESHFINSNASKVWLTDEKGFIPSEEGKLCLWEKK